MELKITFINETVKQFFNSTRRNQCICGGYGSGKTYICCCKIVFLLLAFNRYRVIVARKEYQALMKTTFMTFMKVLPQEYIESYNVQHGTMNLKNGSQVVWMNLDKANETTLRGIEANSIFLDQPEELEEQVYVTLDARLDRWDKATPTEQTLALFGYKSVEEWPKDPKNGKLIIPSYMILSPNPDVETHWIWRYYHPDSPEAQENLATSHDYFEVSSLDNPYLSAKTLEQMLRRDPSWVRRFVYGKWGVSEATIHAIPPESIINPPKEWIQNLLKKSALYRVLDHGETAPTCCTWWAHCEKKHFAYREYYVPRQVISTHRKNIADLSGDEHFVGNYADPAIFKTTMQKYGGHWNVAEEYKDSSIPSPPIYFQPADNNELSTRNRINEYFQIHDNVTHPITNKKGAPLLYFIVQNPQEHNYGVYHIINQTRAQKRAKIAEINGQPIYSDEREPSIEDHAYDTLRYYVSKHTVGLPPEKRIAPAGSFLAARNRAKALKLNRNL